jgi:hypothetical protein
MFFASQPVRSRPAMGRSAALLLGVLALSGCASETVDVDLSCHPARFIVDHKGWPRPFWWPRVTEFAIADSKEELVWHLKSAAPGGELARQLAFIYGRVPPGFEQLFPEKNKAPSPLQRDRTYYVAAAGPSAVYRLIFTLPVEADELRQPKPP